MKKQSLNLVLLFFINLIIFIGTDILFGLFFDPPNKSLNKRNFPFISYPTNYREYFDKLKNETGEIYYGLAHTTYEDKYKKVEPDIRIAAIGDSFTEGQGVRAHDTYPNQITKISKGRVRGYNWGKGGTNVRQIADRFLAKDVAIKYQYIVYAYVLNDALQDWTSSQHTSLSRSTTRAENQSTLKWDLINLRYINFINDQNVFVQSLRQYSNIADFLIRTYEQNSVSQKTIQAYLDLHNPKKNYRGLLKTLEQIELMKKKSSNIHSQFFVAILPIIFWTSEYYPLQAAHENLKQLLKAHAIDYIDLAPALQKYPAKDLWAHPVDQHPNSLGHSIIAKEILNYVLMQSH